MTTREKVLAELKDILAVSDVEDEFAMQDSVLDLVETVFAEDDDSVTEDEQDQISEIVYDLTRSPAEIAEAIITILSADPAVVAEDVDPFVDDIWEDDGMWDDMDEDEIAARTSVDGVNWAEYPDHEYQEGCEGGECKEEVEAPAETEEVTEEVEEVTEEIEDVTEEVEVVDEAYYGKDSIIDGDIPGKTNGFVELISMRFHNMGFDERDHSLFPGEADQMWNPFGVDSVVMYGPDEAFFDPIVAYIESEVGREDSAWYNRDYEVCEVEDRYNKEGPWALCIEARAYDQDEPDQLPDSIKAEYARRRKLRRSSKSAA